MVSRGLVQFTEEDFAIESSYRMRIVIKPKTSSKNAIIRYFYALISFLLKNETHREGIFSELLKLLLLLYVFFRKTPRKNQILKKD